MRYKAIQTVNGQKRVFDAVNGNTKFSAAVTVTPNLDPVMENNEWVDILTAFKEGYAPETWTVGSTKSLTLTDNNTYTIRLCDKQNGRYAYSDGTGSNKCVFEFVELIRVGTTTTFRMNTTTTNTGGFAQSDMRTVTIPTFEALFPTDVLNLISEVNVLSGTGARTTSGTSSSANKLFLAAACEMFGSDPYSIGISESPLGQFDYYVEHNTNADRVKKQRNTDTGYYYWERSPISGNAYGFCFVNSDGSERYGSASNSYGVAPCFAV